MIQFPKRGAEEISNNPQISNPESHTSAESHSFSKPPKSENWNPPRRSGISEAEMERIMLGGAEP